MSFFDWWPKLRNKVYRDQLVASQAKRMIPMQIAALMDQHDLSQAELAERAGLTQGVVSRAANVDYGNLTMNTIVRIAAGLDVAFIGQFVPFSRLVEYLDSDERRWHVADFAAEEAAIRSLEDRHGASRSVTNISDWKQVRGRPVGSSFPMPRSQDGNTSLPQAFDQSNGVEALGSDFPGQSGINGGLKVAHG